MQLDTDERAGWDRAALSLGAGRMEALRGKLCFRICDSSADLERPRQYSKGRGELLQEGWGALC